MWYNLNRNTKFIRDKLRGDKMNVSDSAAVPQELVPVAVLAMLIGAAHDQASLYRNAKGLQPFRAKLEKQADAEMVVQLNLLVGQWFHSGKDRANPKVDTPTARNLTTKYPGFGKTLLEVLNEWKDRHPPRLRFSDAGKVSISYEEPQYGPEGGLFGQPRGTTKPTDIAIYWFVRLLDSPGAHRLSQCANSECKRLFIYKRAPKGTLKNGTFCPQCKGAHSSIRTESRRAREKKKLVDIAAGLWDDWTPSSRMGRDKNEWIKNKMNARLSATMHITRKWVVQNTAAIIEQYLASNRA
jgi:hypothetical protein